MNDDNGNLERLEAQTTILRQRSWERAERRLWRRRLYTLACIGGPASLLALFWLWLIWYSSR
jgi:hypothetical protein